MAKAKAETVTIEVAETEALMSYKAAISLIAEVLRGNPDNGSIVVECLRDIVGATGMDVEFTPNEMFE